MPSCEVVKRLGGTNMAFSFEVIADPTVPFSLIKDANFALEQWSNVLDGKGTLVVDLDVTGPAPLLDGPMHL